MNGEIISIRVLCVTASQPESELWRRGAGQSPVPIEFSVVDAITAAAQLAKGGVDVCILDSKLPDTERSRVITAAQIGRPQPFVVATAPRGTARPEGVDSMIPKPATGEEARKLVERCVRVKFPTRVLVVDDSGTMRSIVRKILSGSRFAIEVYEASEGIAALHQLRSGKFGLVFLDYNMPGLNGFETLSEIKRENPDVGVVMMTSTLDNAIADRAHASGALAFLKKPFYPTDIDAVLQRYFGLHEAVE
jgi:CheY-like chemotaxis protein